MKQLSYLIGACLGATLLTACGGGSETPPAAMISTQMASRARVDRARNPCLTKRCIYVVSFESYNVTVFPLHANGDVEPVQSIQGPYTGLYGPLCIALDKDRNIYVSNLYTPSVTVYSAGASGDVVPIRTISGSNTELIAPYGLAADNLGGVYVTNDYYKFKSVDFFEAGAHGNVFPKRLTKGFKTGLQAPTGIALSGEPPLAQKEMYVTNNTSNSVTTYLAKANGNVSPIGTLEGSYTGLAGPLGIAVSHSGATAGMTYVANSGANNVLIFAAGATGNVAPVTTIGGTNTGLYYPSGVALDATASIYVTSGNAVLVFAPGRARERCADS